MNKLLVAASAMVLVAALTGCSGAAATIPTGPVAQAAPSGFGQSDKADTIPVKLSIEPFKPGDNTFVVATNETGIAAVESQVIMMEMGHGAILDMVQAAPGRYEVASPVIDMEGKWMVRVKLTTTAGEEKLVTFYSKVKSQQ